MKRSGVSGTAYSTPAALETSARAKQKAGGLAPSQTSGLWMRVMPDPGQARFRLSEKSPGKRHPEKLRPRCVRDRFAERLARTSRIRSSWCMWDRDCSIYRLFISSFFLFAFSYPAHELWRSGEAVASRKRVIFT